MLRKFFVFSSIIILAGYARSDLSALLREIWDSTSFTMFDTVLFTAVMGFVTAPCLPLIAALISYFTSWRIRGWIATTIAILIGLCGTFITFMAWALSDTGALIVFIQGITLSAAVAGAILMLSRSNLGQQAALTLLLAPTVVAVWSISAAGAMMMSATSISAGRPYCLIKRPDPEPIDAFSELRGLSFYTTTEWNFHGLLIVQDTDGPVAYNWSPRRMRFDHVLRPNLLLPDPRFECVPERDFLASRSLI